MRRPINYARHSRHTYKLVPVEGVEPPCLKALVSKTSVSANFTIPAHKIWSVHPVSNREHQFGRLRCYQLHSWTLTLELTRGFEPLTVCLQNNGSTVELRQHIFGGE